MTELAQVLHPTADDFDRLRSLQSEFPDSPELWNLRGNWLQLCDVPLDQVRECYERAIACEPTFAVGYESLGSYYDTFGDDLPQAMECFSQALGLGAGDASHLGLARVLAQLNRAAAALHQLDQCVDQASHDIAVLRAQIAAGLWSPDESALL